MSCVTAACVIWYWVWKSFYQTANWFPTFSLCTKTRPATTCAIFLSAAKEHWASLPSPHSNSFAQPKTKATAWVGLDDIESAISLLTAVQGHFAERLTSFELISRFALDLSSEFSQLKKPTDAQWHILIELADSVPDAGLDEKLAEFLYQNGWENSILAQSEQERSDLWTLRENIPLPKQTRHQHQTRYPPSLSPKWPPLSTNCAPALETRFPGIQIVCFGHLGDGSLHYNTFLPTY